MRRRTPSSSNCVNVPSIMTGDSSPLTRKWLVAGKSAAIEELLATEEATEDEEEETAEEETEETDDALTLDAEFALERDEDEACPDSQARYAGRSPSCSVRYAAASCAMRPRVRSVS